MFRLQYFPGSCVAVFGVGLLLGLGHGTQTQAAGTRPTRPAAGNTARASQDPQDAATEFVARRLPGNENLWYVVVLRAKSAAGKSFQIVMTPGKKAAAAQIARFLQQHPKIARNPQSFSHWLQLEMYPTQQHALLRCQAISNYARQSGYR
jgi:hypothetical protein